MRRIADDPLATTIEPPALHAFREGWERCKPAPPFSFGTKPFGTQPCPDYYYWSPITAQWDDYGGFRYKSREALTYPSVMVDGLAIDVKDLFITVTDQHRSLDRLVQPSAKWDPRTGHWIPVLSIFGDPPNPPVFDFSAGTALRDLATACSIGRITPDETARQILALVERYGL